jgi:hypothetical protein
MTDILARQRQLIGTTAQWALNNLVIGDGEYALERTTTGRIRVKVGNGVLTYSALAFVGDSWGATAWTTPSRALGTEYHNTLAWPIAVSAWGQTNGLAETFILYAASASGGTFFGVMGSQSNETGTYEHFLGGLIPAGWYYKILASGSGPVLHGWNELV